ncbi:MAG TPA: DUF3857 domain-containing protein [Puia sp.]|jgi:hypothetical protein|nr:DUF3857 domain-containing protein [Puia sp.]
MRGLLIVILVLSGLPGLAQEKSPVVFGRVSAADFAVTTLGGDTAADVVVISDVGIKSFERPYATSNAWDGYLQHTKRLLILKRRGFEASTVTIPLFMFKGLSEEITELKAATYNLEDGKVVKTELDKKGIYTEKLSENIMTERFAFPAVKVGSIIEYTYKEKSQYGFNNETWYFQGIYPCLWSEYVVSIPSGFIYSIVPHSYLPFYIDTIETKKRSEFGSVYGAIKTFHLVVRNVPALKEQPHTTTIRNWLARVEIRPGVGPLGWRLLEWQLMQSDRFGADLTAGNSWLDKDMQEITAGVGDDLGKARKIYAYVRDHFSCNKRPGYIMANTLKTVYKARSGSEAELNLLLTAMLDHEKLYAVPVLLSTRSNGFLNPKLPQPAVLNYVICKLRCGPKFYYLDVSDPDLQYGQLPLECYNDYDVVIDSAAIYTEANLTADSLTELKKVVVFLSNGDKGGLEGSVQIFPGIAEATEIRKKVKTQGGDKKFQDQLRNGLTPEATVTDLEIDSLRLPDEPLVVNYSCHLATDSTAAIYYFTPILADRMAENPIKDALRIYPVEMPYGEDVNYILTMDIPSGYAVEELPKSERVLLNNNGGYFEYILSQDGEQIHFRTRVRLAKANFQPQEYEDLRNFFSTIVEKESEQIVFKKKK